MATSAGTNGPAFYEVAGARVAHLSYTYGLNGFRLPPDKPWLVDLIDKQAMLAGAADARAAGADFVIVSIHWGTEYQSTPSSFQRNLGRALIASEDIDLIMGHHAHVIQPIERVGDEYIVYGLGNFLSNQRSRIATQDGVIVAAEIVQRGDDWITRGLEITPTWVEGGSFRIWPAAEAVNDGTSALRRSSLVASWNRTMETLLRLGAAGVTPSARP
jgi:poly-gamma-glutamate synthesis protein (capsule biosynthesis protein)